jgi:hypothetical protein
VRRRENNIAYMRDSAYDDRDEKAEAKAMGKDAARDDRLRVRKSS